MASASPLTRSFVSRPDLQVPVLDIRHHEPERASPGHLVFGTWGGAGQYAPYVYDINGELVWSGFVPERSSYGYFNMRTFRFANDTAGLSVFVGTSDGGRGRGIVEFLDVSYRRSATLHAPDPRAALDFHVAELTPGGRTCLISWSEQRQADLSAFGLVSALGWIQSSAFQEIEVDSGRTVFEWRSVDHVPVSDAMISLDPSKGEGASFDRAFDYFHLNSVAKLPDGDFLVSARNTNCIYRVSASDGSIVWRLGGRNSSFEQRGFELWAQHDAIPAGQQSISIFNNGFRPDSPQNTSAIVVELGLTSSPMKATLVQQWAPANGGVARHSGNIQFLADGNVFVGWGAIAEFSEFAPDGHRVLDIALADPRTLVYHVEKRPWTGRPQDTPDLSIRAAASNTSINHFYMSWNGATNVDAWSVYATCSASSCEPRLLGTIARAGFETKFQSNERVSHGFVEALDHQGRVLSRSTTRSVVVDPASLPTSLARPYAASEHERRASAPVAILAGAGILMSIVFLLLTLLVRRYGRAANKPRRLIECVDEQESVCLVRNSDSEESHGL